MRHQFIHLLSFEISHYENQFLPEKLLMLNLYEIRILLHKSHTVKNCVAIHKSFGYGLAACKAIQLKLVMTT